MLSLIFCFKYYKLFKANWFYKIFVRMLNWAVRKWFHKSLRNRFFCISAFTLQLFIKKKKLTADASFTILMLYRFLFWNSLVIERWCLSYVVRSRRRLCFQKVLQKVLFLDAPIFFATMMVPLFRFLPQSEMS
jgi:hypothetical protein